MPLSSHHKTGACAHAQCLYCTKNFRVLHPCAVLLNWLQNTLALSLPNPVTRCCLFPALFTHKGTTTTPPAMSLTTAHT